MASIESHLIVKHNKLLQCVYAVFVFCIISCYRIPFRNIWWCDYLAISIKRTCKRSHIFTINAIREL